MSQAERLSPQQREAFSRPIYRPLLERLYASLARYGVGLDSVTLKSAEERLGVQELCGLPRLPRGSISRRTLDKALTAAGWEFGLPLLVEDVLGRAIPNRSANAQAAKALEDALWQEARLHEALQKHPVLTGWLDGLRQGALTRSAGTGAQLRAERLDDALAVLQALPAQGAPLSLIAVQTSARDPHALDRGRPLTALVLRGVALLADRVDVPRSATGRRRLWGEVGVYCDPLSCDVLVLGLRPLSGGRLGRRLREAAEAGEPQRVTLRELEREPLTLPGGSTVFVCENPGVVQHAADRLGARCAPLICTDGVPSTAALVLLRAIMSGTIRFHGDFDWGGLRIGNILRQQLGASPWRFETADYKQAIAAGHGSLELEGTPMTAGWDEDLRSAMEQTDRAVYEERLVDDLLADLGQMG